MLLKARCFKWFSFYPTLAITDFGFHLHAFSFTKNIEISFWRCNNEVEKEERLVPHCQSRDGLKQNVQTFNSTGNFKIQGANLQTQKSLKWRINFQMFFIWRFCDDNEKVWKTENFASMQWLMGSCWSALNFLFFGKLWIVPRKMHKIRFCVVLKSFTSPSNFWIFWRCKQPLDKFHRPSSSSSL